jgi:DNA invertase Pin-like site-specific DNA recombinase
MNTSEVVQPTHVQRQAVIYVRQSTQHQALNNQESLRMQYALSTRAVELGWKSDDVRVVDSDVGRTASNAKGRRGFQELVADVTLGKVGMILAYDATRLARNCADWYQLLDLCGYRGCLIADRDGVYDPGSVNGRLLLGLKGQISELELHTIRIRLNAGVLNKAQRGELARTLPAGLVRDPSGQVFKDPNLEVQNRITLLFETFLKQRSSDKVLRFFIGHDLPIPRKGHDGDIYWRVATKSAIIAILKQPAYAGAYVYGRTRYVFDPDTGKKSLPKHLPREEWKVCIQDKFPAYISWETYEQIQAMLSDNRAKYGWKKSRGAPRSGGALLQGIVYCGECGHKMTIQYKAATKYRCEFLRREFGGPVCQFIPAYRVDDHVVQLFLKAFSAAELDLHNKVVEDARRQRDDIFRSHQQQLDRLRYQARLAERQFNQSDPDNRLVTAELERRWEQALRDLKSAEDAFERQHRQFPSLPVFDAASRQLLENVGRNLPEMWTNGRLSQQQKKALLRSLIDKVAIHRSARDTVHCRVVWKGGEVTTVDIPIPVGSWPELSQAKELESRILQLAAAGCGDEEIARHLTQEGYRSPMRDIVLPSTVATVRLRHRTIVAHRQSHRFRIPGYLTVPQIAAKLCIPPDWIRYQIHKGIIQVTKEPQTRFYLFPDQAKTLERFRKLVVGKLKRLHF